MNIQKILLQILTVLSLLPVANEVLAQPLAVPTQPELLIESIDSGNPTDLSVSQTIKPGETPDGIDDCSWACVQEQMRMGKYKTFANDEGGYNTANTRFGFHIDYQADGTTQIKPYKQGGTDYHIGMRLAGLGYDELQTLENPTALHAENIDLASGSKLTYQWNEQVTEWWINQEDRLEQWFYLREAPQGKTANQDLRLRLALDTDMALSVEKDKLTFSKESHHINYDKFKAWDATGKALAVHFSQEGDYIDLHIDDEAAQYPLTIDPSYSQTAYLKASNTGASDNFGFSVAISGETIVVGALGELSNATGVNGDETNNSVSFAGAAYVFIRIGGTWAQQAYLKASNTDIDDRFGRVVAISGETIVIGASQEESNATGVNGDETNNSALNAGAAYVFVRTGGLTGTWAQQAYLKASNTGDGDQFGFSVAISDETIVVGARYEDSNATGVNGNETNSLALNAGAAYVFVRTGGLTGTWAQQAYLKASNTGSIQIFGEAVAISGETIVVGANGERSNATGVNGDETNTSASNAGAAYVFVRTGGLTGTWAQQAYLKASNTDAQDRFGISVAFSGETIVVGAYREGSNAIGVNGNETDNSLTEAGAAYVFVRTGGLTGTWSQQAYLKASNAGTSDAFGLNSSINGETIVVTAQGEDSNATGINGDETNNSASLAGAAYVFGRTGGLTGTWAQQAYLKTSNMEAGDLIRGGDISDDGTIVLGAYREGSNATGVNGDELDNSVANAGAVYVFYSPPTIDLNFTGNVVSQTGNEGEFLTYIFTLTNEATDTATGVKARVLIPSNTSFVAAIPSQGTYDANTKIWEVGTVPTGSQTIEVTVKME